MNQKRLAKCVLASNDENADGQVENGLLAVYIVQFSTNCNIQ